MGLGTMLSSLFTTLWVWESNIISTFCLWTDGLIYDLLSKVYKLFTLVCQLNFSSLESIISPLTDRLKAVIMVVIFLKAGILLIRLIIKPDDIQKSGSGIIKNIFIVGAMLVSCNLVFNVLNEVSMLIVGVPDGYQFKTLSSLAGVNDNNDKGLINRFVFGGDSDINDIGDYVAFETLSIFVRDAANETESTVLAQEISNGDGYDFTKVSNVAPKVGKDVVYTGLISGLVGLYLMYCLGTLCIEIAIRMFKLVVLQLIAPLAIISRLDDKSKVFDQFVKTYTSTYLSAFLRITSVLIMNVFVGQFLKNIDLFFGNALSDADGFLTKAFLMLIVIVAGYSFVKKLPEFLKEVTGKDFGKSNDFGNVVGGALGLGLGAVSGGITGAAAGAGIGGILANMGMGALRGGAAGLKGQGISDKVKNLSAVNKGNATRAGTFAQNGLGSMIAGVGYGLAGTAARQDSIMGRYDAATNAIKAYDASRVEAIKDQKLSENLAGFISGVDAEGNATGAMGIKFGDDKDAYASKMLEYNEGYIGAQADLKNAETASYASEAEKKDAIVEAQKALIGARESAIKAAEDAYDNAKENSINTATDDAKANISAKRAAADAALKKAGVEWTKDGDKVNTKKTMGAITNKKHALENKPSYGATHGGKKK